MTLGNNVYTLLITFIVFNFFSILISHTNSHNTHGPPVFKLPVFWPRAGTSSTLKFDWSIIFPSLSKYGTCENRYSRASDKANTPGSYTFQPLMSFWEVEIIVCDETKANKAEFCQFLLRTNKLSIGFICKQFLTFGLHVFNFSKVEPRSYC